MVGGVLLRRGPAADRLRAGDPDLGLEVAGDRAERAGGVEPPEFGAEDMGLAGHFQRRSGDGCRRAGVGNRRRGRSRPPNGPTRSGLRGCPARRGAAPGSEGVAEVRAASMARDSVPAPRWSPVVGAMPTFGAGFGSTAGDSAPTIGRGEGRTSSIALGVTDPGDGGAAATTDTGSPCGRNRIAAPVRAATRPMTRSRTARRRDRFLRRCDFDSAESGPSSPPPEYLPSSG